ncbi:MAG: hypothetical protein H7Z75_20240 [Ferruginibacter sp.]|nr:hypothetical protein [Cytophagales bacterium]
MKLLATCAASVFLSTFSHFPTRVTASPPEAFSRWEAFVPSRLKSQDEYPGPEETRLQVTTPVSRIVYQRSNTNQAVIPVRGTCPGKTTSIEARLVARAPGQGVTTAWMPVGGPPSNGTFSGTVNGQGGWYNLEVRAKTGKSVAAPAVVERVGIGEVFIAVGHSVAQGGDTNLEGATDDRVSVVAVDEKQARFDAYLKTGDPRYLPEPVFVPAATGVAPAPFAHGAYFWSKFAERVAQRENVPVLLYNAAFGGTSLEHWAKSAQNIPFEHGFVRSAIRMPYVNLLNTFKKYIPLTGLRALLADQGANDWTEKEEERIFRNYQLFIQQARQDLGYPELALVVNRHTTNAPSVVRSVQDRMAKEPHCFPGPDYDALAKEDRYDGIHLSETGATKAAQLWAAALTPAFFEASKPWQPAWK